VYITEAFKGLFVKEQILKLVRDRGDVTFVELEREIPGFKGDMELALEKKDNAILWQGISQPGVDALASLISGKQIAVEPCGLEPYLYVGFKGFPGIKMVDDIRKVTKPAWFPVVLVEYPR
jgi:hypothetical protein